MKERCRKVPMSKAPKDFFIPLEALKLLQSQDVREQLPPPFPFKPLRR